MKRMISAAACCASSRFSFSVVAASRPGIVTRKARRPSDPAGRNGTMLEFGIEKLYRDATMYLHMDDTVDVTKFKIVKNLFPDTAGKYAGPEA